MLHISRRQTLLLALLLIAPSVLFTLYFTGWLKPHVRKEIANDTVVHCNPGPWGDLEYIRILTEPPEQQVTANYPLRDFAVWTFKNFDQAQFTALWQKAELSPAQIATINHPDNWQVAGNVTLIKVPKDIVFGLSTQSRNVIYSALSLFQENKDQNEPYRFRAEAEEEWFKDSGLKPETIEQVKRLLYRRGASVLFSDQGLLMPTINSLEERTKLLKTLARKSTMLVRLRIKPDTDVDALERYWGGNRNKDISPLLRSLTGQPNGVSLDIVHLLPPFVRSHIYTYPAARDPGSKTYMDCHWTVLNFFNRTPDRRYEDLNEVTVAFRDNYHPVTGRAKYGDIFLFALPNGDIIHSCVYIADNIVFTKNGATPSAPWILMTLQDVIAFYPSEHPLDIQRYRPNIL
ncbi:MAG: hypothetical protein K9M98_07090 [Cephaloticoccus sp.]|nr:hypothetical protein [Cephaloticoccus sp.]